MNERNGSSNVDRRVSSGQFLTVLRADQSDCLECREKVLMDEANYVDTMPPQRPGISKKIWRMISKLRPGGRRHYREKATPFSVNPNPRKFHRIEERKRRRQIKNLSHRGEWAGKTRTRDN